MNHIHQQKNFEIVLRYWTSFFSQFEALNTKMILLISSLDHLPILTPHQWRFQPWRLPTTWFLLIHFKPLSSSQPCPRSTKWTNPLISGFTTTTLHPYRFPYQRRRKTHISTIFLTFNTITDTVALCIYSVNWSIKDVEILKRVYSFLCNHTLVKI